MTSRTYTITIETANPAIDVPELDTAMRAAVASMAEDIYREGLHALRVSANDASGVVVSEIDYKGEVSEYDNNPLPLPLETKYQTVTGPDGETDIWEFRDVKDMDPHVVWSLIDGDEDNNSYAAPGFHIVNRWGYTVTTTPWTDENEVYLWAEGSIEDDENTEDAGTKS
ncbi:hypothetical protein [Tessaracoccus sp.]